ncbi:MAG: HIT domain-containing protein [Thermoplasmata archaeon]|jgi:histidine triad (HIT) family protein
MARASPDAKACIFCDIAAHRIPAYIVYEDAEAVAFLDLFPFTRGHLLVVPKHHVARLTELPPAEYAPYVRALATMCRRVDRLTRDYNVSSNQGAAAGQIVFHLHFHVIPRYGEANPFHTAPRERLSEEDARTLVATLSAP